MPQNVHTHFYIGYIYIPIRSIYLGYLSQNNDRCESKKKKKISLQVKHDKRSRLDSLNGHNHCGIGRGQLCMWCFYKDFVTETQHGSELEPQFQHSCLCAVLFPRATNKNTSPLVLMLR